MGLAGCARACGVLDPGSFGVRVNGIRHRCMCADFTLTAERTDHADA